MLGSGASILISVAQAFLLMPLGLDVLGGQLYGAWLAATELLTWIQVLDLGIPNLVTQRVGAAVGKGDRDATGQWFAAGQFCLIVTGVVLMAIGVAGAPFVTRWAQVPAHEANVFTACFQTGVVANVLLMLFNGFLGLSRGVQRTAIVNAASVAGATAGFATALGMLIAGFGLWALAAGFVVRALICLAGGLVFLANLTRGGYVMPLRPPPAVVREIVHLTPPMAAANVGYLFANLSELVLVNTFFGPVVALVYAVTRRMADGVRMLLDTIAWAVYGGFAHLVTSDERHRARQVLSEVLSLRFACACLGAAVYVAVNQSLVTLLFGAENFGGLALTFAFGLQLIVAGQGFLVNYLYRAAGHVREGSLLLAGEAVVRVAAIIAGLRLGGLVAAPAAATASAWTGMAITSARLSRILPPSDAATGEATRLRAAGVVIFSAGVLAAAAQPAASWPAVAMVAATLTVAGGGAMVLLQSVESRRRILASWIGP